MSDIIPVNLPQRDKPTEQVTSEQKPKEIVRRANKKTPDQHRTSPEIPAGYKLVKIEEETEPIHAKPVEQKPVEQVKTRQQREMERDQELIRGTFNFHENPGGVLRFPFRQHKGKIKHYALRDGEEFELPRDVARHLNQNCKYPVYQEMNVDGRMMQAGVPVGGQTMRAKKWVARTSFIPRGMLDIHDDDMMPSKNLVEVEKII